MDQPAALVCLIREGGRTPEHGLCGLTRSCAPPF